MLDFIYEGAWTFPHNLESQTIFLPFVTVVALNAMEARPPTVNSRHHHDMKNKQTYPSKRQRRKGGRGRKKGEKKLFFQENNK